MVALFSDTPRGRLARGAVEGAAVAAVVLAALRYGTAAGRWPSPLTMGLVLVAGAVLAGLSRLACRGVIGAVVGALLGGVLGAQMSGGEGAAQAMDHPVGGGPFVGQKANLAGMTLDGRAFDVAELRGKVVLVDFWAAWCRPCLEELPGLKRFHARRQAEGLEVVGVSLDASLLSLRRKVAQESLPWDQLTAPPDRNAASLAASVLVAAPAPGSPVATTFAAVALSSGVLTDLSRSHPLANRYDVEGIPFTLLLDREGTIVAQGLRGAQLYRAAERALRDEPAAGETAWGAVGVVGLFVVLGWLAGVALESAMRASDAAPAPAERRGRPV